MSTTDQNPDGQRDALTAAGVPRQARRATGVGQALLVATRPGDQLVVTELDRPGRTLGHLIDLAADLAERQVDPVVLDQGSSTEISFSSGAGRVRPPTGSAQLTCDQSSSGATGHT
ncbi:recombinase family protein [Nocardia higoensis]|uniref:recombinase family protein n=1 Tax=Nocardia higoensis TaxID=228599 RepID=UPI00031E181A|nr:recombinase family protein [Nocardia higoensis]